VKAFDAKAQCFIEQYNEFTIQGSGNIDHYVNGWGTLGENIADNGGLKMAFEAWQQRYRSDLTGKR
jgi:endothelin-converting enzyme